MNSFNKGQQKWYRLNRKDIIKKLNTDPKNGLSTLEVTRRQTRDGKNKLTEAKKESHFKKFFKQFHDVLIYVLIVAAIITTILGQYIDTTVIALVIIINAFIGYIQENKAEEALDVIKTMLSLHANVIRDGQRTEIEAEDLVKGDIVLLSAGDKVPADIRLIHSANLTVEEAALTGESLSVEKKPETIIDDVALGDCFNMMFSGTSISTGTGTGVVVETGNRTELGKISESLTEIEPIKTPLIKQTEKFGKQIAITIVGFAIFMFVFAFFLRDYELGELALGTIAMIVAAIPEGLPAIMSIILAIGVQNMAKKKAIVRNLPSVETLGAVSVICTDKTGTLTKNEMTARSIVTEDHYYEVTGTGYKPEGDILKNGNKVDIENDQPLMDLLLSIQTANDATLTKDENNQWTINGEPTDGSLITLAKKANKKLEGIEIEAKIPFDSEYKYMATLATFKEQKYIFIKGAPDRLFDLAESKSVNNKTSSTTFNRERWEEEMLNLAKRGERVIGVAYKKIPNDQTSLTHDDLKEGITFQGLVGIIDPPREEAIVAVEECKNAGIKVKMITGDHPETAYAIGKQMGIGNGYGAIEGKELESMADDEFKEAVNQYDIFARTSPNDKLRLVEALQANGNICAMTGDGVNDAPSLKKADIGVAMGIKGTEAAKDASEMVLVDDNFKTIENAVEEGRRVYDNLKKTILFILPTNGAEAFLVIGSIIFGVSMILTPVQILWVNMITAITISMALAFESIEKGTMTRPPRPKNAHLLNGYYVFRILYVSLLIGISCLYFYIHLLNQGHDLTVIRTIIVNAIVFAELFYLFNSRSEKEPAINKDFFFNKIAFIVSGLLILFELAITYIPFFNTVLQTTPITLKQWTFPILLGVSLFIIVEIEKAITRTITKK